MKRKPATLLCHDVNDSSLYHGAVVPPIFQNSLFTFNNWDAIDNAFNNREHNFTIHDSPEGSVNRRCPNIDKLKSLGHTKKMELTEGLKQTYEWYYERLKK